MVMMRKFDEFGNSCFIDQRWWFLKIIPSYLLRNPSEKRKIKTFIILFIQYVLDTVHGMTDT